MGVFRLMDVDLTMVFLEGFVSSDEHLVSVVKSDNTPYYSTSAWVMRNRIFVDTCYWRLGFITLSIFLFYSQVGMAFSDLCLTLLFQSHPDKPQEKRMQ